MARPLSPDAPGGEVTRLRVLEESLWRPDTRFDATYLDSIMAPDFVEIGRSGRRYTRSEILATAPRPIGVTLPLPGFRVRMIGDVAIVTYTSDERPERSHRTSVWRRHRAGWLLEHHQGTPIPEGTPQQASVLNEP